MPIALGSHADRLAAVRALKTAKGRRDQGAFAFEGATLLREAHRSGLTPSALYVTQDAYDAAPLVRELDAQGVPTYLIDARAAAKISDLETPAGIVATAPGRLASLESAFEGDGLVLILADLNDPGNAGTLLRSADAFGCRAVVFGRLGAEPYHPKVVRAAMGALFRLPLVVADPAELALAARTAGFEIFALDRAGGPLADAQWPARTALLVGHERQGLGRWDEAAQRRLAIPMTGAAESLNAGVAGSIGLYEAARRMPSKGS